MSKNPSRHHLRVCQLHSRSISRKLLLPCSSSNFTTKRGPRKKWDCFAGDSAKEKWASSPSSPWSCQHSLSISDLHGSSWGLRRRKRWCDEVHSIRSNCPLSLKTLSELYFNLIRLASIRYIFSFTDLTKSQKVKKQLIRNKNSFKNYEINNE